MPRFRDRYEAGGGWPPLPADLTDYKRRRVLLARDPDWLREQARQHREVADDGGGRGAPVKMRLAALQTESPYLRLRPVEWLYAEADRLEERADAIEAGGRPPDDGVVVG